MLSFYFINFTHPINQTLIPVIFDSINEYELIEVTDRLIILQAEEEHMEIFLSSVKVLSTDLDNMIQVLISPFNDQYFNLLFIEGHYNQVTHLSTLLLVQNDDNNLFKRVSNYFKGLDRETILIISKYLECGLNESKAAKLLYMHRNTLRYKLDNFYKQTRLNIRNYQNSIIFLAYLFRFKIQE